MTKTYRKELHALKRDTGMDYTHADYQTQEGQADAYLAAVAAMQSAGKPKPKSEEQKEAEHEQHLADVYNRYRRNNWHLPKNYDGIEWERIITVQGASEALGITRGRVHQLIKAGQLNAHKVDNIWLIDRASVEERISKEKSRQ